MVPHSRRVLLLRLLLLLLGVALPAQSCSRKALGVILDLPPAPEDEAQAEGEEGVQPPSGLVLPAGMSSFLLSPEDTIVPELEGTLDPDSVLRTLPRDHAGNVDWVAAWRSGLIRPRNGVDGPRSRPPWAFDFKFDFYLPGPTEQFDAFFPHSVHTEQIDCAQCHPRIFKRRGTTVTMADVLQGRYCGECHGKVAFAPATACERCHTAMQLPPDRAQPRLIGTVQMKRATEILGDTVTIAGNAAGVRTDNFPRARFPHWVHRIRFQCRTCHMEIFEPRAGSNAITMADINAGEFCGQCHNDRVAFMPSMTNCARCHPAEPAAAPQGGPRGASGG